MLLLDTFCKAGGAGYGYHLAGFDVVGVDIEPQKNYPFPFIQSDAFEFIERYGHYFDVIHASPPCQSHSVTKSLHKNKHPELVGKTRNALKSTGKPYIIENVPGAPLFDPVMLCGTMFGLKTIRHRLFECNPVAPYFTGLHCRHIGKATGGKKAKGNNSLMDGFSLVTVVGHEFIVSEGRGALGIAWMTGKELSQAIPPAYTKWLGEWMIKELN